MQIGIFTRTFPRPTLSETLETVVAHGLSSVQFGFDDIGLAEMPDQIDPALCDTIRQEFAAQGIRMAALSGTWNMIHPDLAERQAGVRRLGVLAANCARLGTNVITLCTGTRNASSMWRPHPDNQSADAWRELTATMAQALPLAEAHNVILGVEPEVSNVIDSAERARRLLDEMKSPNLKIVMDGANLFHHGELPRMSEILDHAFELLGDDIIIAHAKDLVRDGEAGNVAAGTGLLDYERYLRLLDATGRDLPILLHSLSEQQAKSSVAFLREKQPLR